MNNKTEAQIYTDTFEFVRGLSKFYFSRLGNIDVSERIKVAGKKFNSPYWIAAHLTWSEHFLLLIGLGAEPLNIPWLEKFKRGTVPPDDINLPKYEDVMRTMDEVHAKAMEKVKSLTQEQLDEPNNIDATFGGVNSKRAIIRHCIRHEPMHIGQLSWYLKLNDIEMP
jgi:hypothetical protein